MKIRLPFSGSLELKIDNFFGTSVTYLQAGKPKWYSCKTLRSKCKLVWGFFPMSFTSCGFMRKTENTDFFSLF